MAGLPRRDRPLSSFPGFGGPEPTSRMIPLGQSRPAVQSQPQGLPPVPAVRGTSFANDRFAADARARAAAAQARAGQPPQGRFAEEARSRQLGAMMRGEDPNQITPEGLAWQQRQQSEAGQLQSQQNLARYRLGGQNRTVYESMGNPSANGARAAADSVLAGGLPQQRGDMSGFGLRQLSVPQSQGLPLNARGDGSFTPSGSGPTVEFTPEGRAFVPNNRGGRPRFFDGRGGEAGYQNSAGGQSQIGTTASGRGLAFTGLQNADGTRGGLPMTPELQARLSERSTQRRDDRILRNAAKYGLSEGLPAVAGARGRQSGRIGSSQQKQALFEAIMQQHMEHASSLPTPLERIKYLQDLHNQMSGIPVKRVALTPKRGGPTINPGAMNPIAEFDFGNPGL